MPETTTPIASREALETFIRDRLDSGPAKGEAALRRNFKAVGLSGETYDLVHDYMGQGAGALLAHILLVTEQDDRSQGLLRGLETMAETGFLLGYAAGKGEIK